VKEVLLFVLFKWESRQIEVEEIFCFPTLIHDCLLYFNDWDESMSVEGVIVKVLNLEKFSLFLSCTQGFLFCFLVTNFH